MEITFKEIMQGHLTHIKDNRTLIKWLEKENVYYLREPFRCFKEEFAFALLQKQISDIKMQNPLDYEERIEKLASMENKNLPTAPITSNIASPTTKQVLNPAYKNQEKLTSLKLGKKEAVPGLIIYCKHKDCKSKKKSGVCRHSAEFEQYKLIISTKAVETSFMKEFNSIRNEEEAKALARELRRITFLNGAKPKSLLVPEKKETNNLYILPNLIDEHLEHLTKIAGNQIRFLKSQRKMYDIMLQVFENNGVDPVTIEIDQLEVKLPDGFTWLKKIEIALDNREGKKKGKPISTTTKNNYIKLYRSAYKFAKDKRKIEVNNPFLSLKIVNVNQTIKNNIKTPKTHELSRLFKMLRNKIELNKKRPSFSKAKNKYVDKTFKYYQPYLLDGILLAIAFGYRSDNILNLKWSDIDLTEAYASNSILNGVIIVEDIKVNNQKKQFKDDNKKFIMVRINNDIEELLLELGYENYKGTDNYILAPLHHHQRNTIINNISKGFHHYMLEINPLKDFQFKDLRKTEISHEGKNTSTDLVSKRVHGDFSTTFNNYFDDSILLCTAKENPRVFKGVRLLSL